MSEDRTTSTAPPMISMCGVVKEYRTKGRGIVHAVDGIDLDVARGETLGLVGESGCGKSTTARLLVQLEPATSGRIVIDGTELATASRAERARLKRTIQMVFQDPSASLDPRVPVGDAIGEVLAVHHMTARGAAHDRRIAALMDMVGLPGTAASRLPHELSGGQRQRIGIARALAIEPKILVLDEAVSALDVSVRAEIMNLLTRLRRELSLTYVFISHDLGMVRHISDRIAVMYLGQVVEIGSWRDVSDHPAHPYTAALHDAIPASTPGKHSNDGTVPVRGEVPDAARPPAGCRFNPRCPLAETICRQQMPQLEPFGGDGGHLVRCHVVGREQRTATEILAAKAGQP